MNKKIKRSPKYKVSNVPQIITDKGITVEWAKGIEGRQVTIYHRRKGSKFADHFHTGSDSSKDPEMFYLIQGRVAFEIYDTFTDKQEEIIVEAGQELLIYPYLYHKAEALEDCIFLEYKSEEFNPDQADIHDWQAYQSLKKDF